MIVFLNTLLTAFSRSGSPRTELVARPVAVKRLTFPRVSPDAMMHKWRSEAQIWIDLSHPNVLRSSFPLATTPEPDFLGGVPAWRDL